MKLRRYKEIHKYDDMIDLAHHLSGTHPHMPVEDRAAQFAPFAALTGHHEAVRETARLTEERIEIDENCKAVLDGKLQNIYEHLDLEPSVSITYFVPDPKKPGGAYVTVSGCVRKIREHERTVVLTDGTEIPIDEITDIVEGKEDPIDEVADTEGGQRI